MNTDSSLIRELADREYRAAYVASQINIGLPLQVRALRKARDWTQAELAKRAGMSQPRIAEIERPGGRRLNIETMLRLAAAFDVALQVRFAPFGDFIDWSEGFDPNHYGVPTFEQEVAEAGAERAMRDSITRAQAAISRSQYRKETARSLYVVFSPSAEPGSPRQLSLLRERFRTIQKDATPEAVSENPTDLGGAQMRPGFFFQQTGT